MVSLVFVVIFHKYLELVEFAVFSAKLLVLIDFDLHPSVRPLLLPHSRNIPEVDHKERP